jgi:hypothetical protein
MDDQAWVSADVLCSASGKASSRAAPDPYLKNYNDPTFAEKVEDAVDLYMIPPAHTVIVSIDEKSQILPSAGPSPASRRNAAP